MESYRIAMPVRPPEDVWGRMEEENVFFDAEGKPRPPYMQAGDVEGVYGKVPPSAEEIEEARALGKNKPRAKAPQYAVGTTYFYNPNEVYTINGRRYIIVSVAQGLVTLGDVATGQKTTMPYDVVARAVSEQNPYAKQNLQEINEGIEKLNKRTTPQGLENATKTFQNLPLQVASLQTVIRDRIEVLDRIIAASEEKMNRSAPGSVELLNQHMDQYIRGELGRREVRDFMDYILTRYQYNYGALISKVSRDGVEGLEEQLNIDTPEGVDRNLLLRFLQSARDARPKETAEREKQEFNLMDYAIERDILPLSTEDVQIPLKAVKGHSGYEGMKKSMYAVIMGSREDRADLQAMSDKLNEFFGYMRDTQGTVLDRAFLASERGQAFLSEVYDLLTAPEIKNFVERYHRSLVVDGQIDPKKMGNLGASAGNALVACGFLKLVAVLKKLFTDNGFDPTGPDGLERILPPSRRRRAPTPARQSTPRESTEASYKSAKVIFKKADSTQQVFKLTREEWEGMGLKNGWIK